MQSIKYNTKLSVILENYFNKSDKLINFNNLEDYLSNISPSRKYNKTTIYRQLDKMVKNQILNVFKINNSQMWEKNSNLKHEHLTCQICNKIICIQISRELVKNISNSHNITIKSINLFGTCSLCNNIGS